MKIVTAHDLRTGIVLYRKADGGWSESLAEGHAYADEEADAAASHAKAQATHVTNVYLIEADADATPSKRVLLRESIRAKGPTVRLDLGKQAEGA